MSTENLWIFGYGSLVWRPAFPHLRARPASIGGYARRFWQGSTDHRGVPGRPGRVVTLLPDAHASLHDDPKARSERCWGTAYEIPRDDPDGVVAGLDHRERGGYERVELEIELIDETALGSQGAESARRIEAADEGRPRRVLGLVYIAGPDNDNYLGSASIEDIADQIATSAGPSGANPEYVYELANRLRAMQASDRHVFAVESALQRVMAGSA